MNIQVVQGLSNKQLHYQNNIEEYKKLLDSERTVCNYTGSAFLLFLKGAVMRPSKDNYYLSIAEAVMTRSTCIRRKYGAVIVNNDEIISTGYNGAPRGELNCCDIDECYREEHAIPHGERYEACCSVHAEMNAIISASRQEMQGATLYLACNVPNAKPCDMCRRVIKNAGISKVVTREKVIEVQS